MGKKQVARDFEKKVVKVGKVKKGPANVTDTSFTAKKLAIRAQNLAKSQPINSTNLLDALKPILSACGHYAASSRREALSQLAVKLFILKNEQLVPYLDPMLSATLKTICDEDDAVRQKSLLFFSELFGKFPDTSLAPFLPRFLAFLRLALSHLNSSIQDDSLKFLQLMARNEATFGPALVDELPSLAVGMLPLVKQYLEMSAIGNKKLSPYHLNLELLTRWLRARQASIKDWSLTRATPIVDYTWQASQSQSLCIVRPKENQKSSASMVACSIPPEQVNRLCSQMCNLTVSSWLDCVPSTALLCPKIKDESLLQLLGIYSTLYIFSCESGGSFWDSVHPHLRKHRDLLEERLGK